MAEDLDSPLGVVFADGPAGVSLLGVLPEQDRDLLRIAYDASLRKLAKEWARSLARKTVFWVNLWQRSGDAQKLAIERIEELDAWSRRMVELVYAADDVALDGYGWIVNPVGSTMQEWHIDYALDYSTIFIPLSRLTPQNCLQYLVIPQPIEKAVWEYATADLDRVDLDYLLDHTAYLSVRQLLARPYSVIKLDFQTIHRGVGNTGDFDRVLFWVSVKKRGELLPPEPLVEIIK